MLTFNPEGRILTIDNNTFVVSELFHNEKTCEKYYSLYEVGYPCEVRRVKLNEKLFYEIDELLENILTPRLNKNWKIEKFNNRLALTLKLNSCVWYFSFNPVSCIFELTNSDCLTEELQDLGYGLSNLNILCTKYSLPKLDEGKLSNLLVEVLCTTNFEPEN